MDFIKTGEPLDTYGTPGAPCVACSCKDFAECDNFREAAAAGGSYGVKNSNWRHPGSGSEYN